MIAIRVDPKPDDRLIGRVFFKDERVVVARPDIPKPDSGDASFPAVGLSRYSVYTTWPLRDGVVLTPKPQLCFSSSLMVREAVLAGAGAALLPRLSVIKDLEEKRLALWGVLDRDPVEIWRLHSSRRLVSAKVQAFFQKLDAHFATS